MSDSAYTGSAQVSDGKGTGRRAGILSFVRVVDALSIAGTYVAATCLVALTLLMLAQISVGIISKFFPAVRGDIPIVWEYGSYLMGATFMLGSAMTLRAGRHIRLGLVTDNVGPLFRRVLDVAVSLLALALVGFLPFSLGRATVQAMISGSSSIASQTPLWIPLSVFAVGSLFLALQLLVRVLAVIWGIPPEDESLRVGSEDE